MQKDARKYQRKDYASLLKDLNTNKLESEPNAAEEPFAPEELSPEKERRNKLMAKKEMRYAYSILEVVIHDKDCPKAAQIPDKDFCMSDQFLSGKVGCIDCYRRAIIRNGIQPGDEKNLSSYVRVFTKLRAKDLDLVDLFFIQKAKLYKVEPNAAYILLREDRWMIREEGAEICLYHNNYEMQRDYSRTMNIGFHLQAKARTFQRCISYMCNYTWEGHLASLHRKRAEKMVQQFRPH